MHGHIVQCNKLQFYFIHLNMKGQYNDNYHKTEDCIPQAKK